MEERTYEVIAAVERTHWWYRARRRVLGAVLEAERAAVPPRGPGADRARVLDLGCGTGANLPLAERCGLPIGCDFSGLALEFARSGGGYAALARADAGKLPFAASTFDWVFALDILEHLDDTAAAAEIRRVLKPAGRALITVPAFPSLWGPQDDAAHHLRRYRRRDLRDLLQRAGLRVHRLSHINAALFVPIWAVRKTIRLLGIRIASENTLHPGWANPILERVFGAEARVVPRVSLPFGVSLLCVAERPAPFRPS